MAEGIIINGVTYSKEYIIDLCSEKLENPEVAEWEKSIFLFISHWYNNDSFFTVNTSGSTGAPQTIRIEKSYAIASAKLTINYFKLKPLDTLWLCIPADYIAGKMMIVRAIIGGMNLVYSKPQSIPQTDIALVDFCAMVPNQVVEMFNSVAGRDSLSKIQKLLIGGAAISDDLERLIAENHSLNVWQSYGMTETITHVGIKKIVTNNIGFTPMPGVGFSLDKDNRLIVDAPHIGVKSLLTNDIAKLYESGKFEIMGRMDNIIISGGKKYQPEIIENAISDLLDCNYFIGSLTDSKLGMKIVLFVDGDLGKELKDELFINMQDRLHKHRCPKDIIFIERFIYTGSGKINRKATTEIYKANK